MAFMNGLKPKTRTGVRMFEPRTLKKMMSAERMVEDWAEQDEPIPGNSSGGGERNQQYLGEKELTCVSGGDAFGANLSRHKGNSFNQPQMTPFTNWGNKNLNSQIKANQNRGSPFRKLSEAEIREKRAKGLCFKCDGRYQ